MIPRLLLPAALVLMAASVSSQAASTATVPADSPPLKLIDTVPLPNISGGDFDHFAVDLTHRIMYVPAEVQGTIESFELPSGKHLSSVKNVARGPHYLMLSNHGEALWVADNAAAGVHIVDTKTFHIERTIAMAPGPDSGVVDRAHGLLYLGNGGTKAHSDTAFISVISLADRRVIDTIPIDGAQVKAMVIDPASRRLFVNIRDKRQVAVIDLNTRKVVEIWDVPGPSVNSAMALDASGRRLFIGSRNPGKLIVMDADSGAVMQTLPIVNIADEMIFDAKRKQLYIAGQGGLDVVREHAPNQYAIVQHLDTLGGKTAAYVASLDKLYVVHSKGPDAAEAGLQVFDVQ